MADAFADELAKQAMQQPVVEQALHKIAAEEVLPRAASLAAQAGLPELAASLRVEDGVRPKGRTYSRVVADHDEAEAYEHGDTNHQRARILGRAAGVSIWPDA